MSTAAPFLPPVLAIVNELLTTKKIPALNGDEMETLCSHLFTMRNRDHRIQIAEIAFYNHDDSQALNIFLACTMPLAQRMAERRAIRIFVQPTAWQGEAMYDGAVAALLELFGRKRSQLSCSVPNAFRRYLMRTIIYGTMYAFRVRQENFGIQGVEDVTLFSDVKKPYRNPVEREMITRELLEQVTHFPHLREDHSRLLKTIAALGAEKALRDQSYYWNGRHAAGSKQNRGRRAMLDSDAVAKAMGVSRMKLQNLLKESREILRDAFNRDGTLFVAS
jgi:hypothetical protein